MKSKVQPLYQVREWPDDDQYSVLLGSKLRTYARAAKVARRIRRSGRSVFLAKVLVTRSFKQSENKQD